jgi:hypothetical protein
MILRQLSHTLQPPCNYKAALVKEVTETLAVYKVAMETVADKAVVEAGEIIKEGVQVEADVEDEVST